MIMSIDELKQHIVVLKNQVSSAECVYNTMKHSYIGLFNTLNIMEEAGMKTNDKEYKKLKQYDMNVENAYKKKVNIEKELMKYEKRLYHRLYYQKIKDVKKEEYQKKKAKKINK